MSEPSYTIRGYNPDILTYEILSNEPQETVARVEVRGRGNVITNHLSYVDITIQKGDGYILVGDDWHFVEAGDTVEVPRKTPYQYAGALSMRTTIRPMLIPETVTFGDEKLPRYISRLIRQAYRKAEVRPLMQEYYDKLIHPTVQRTLLVNETVEDRIKF